jgi:Fic family protein
MGIEGMEGMNEMTIEKYIWEPITFDAKWLETSTLKLDNILPSWKRKRERFKENENEYLRFINELKRKQAIETGIIERLYDLKEGITETFIREGFIDSYLQHGDTNIQPNLLMYYLNDHFEAIDFIFDFVKSNRQISKSFILELHQLITAHQDEVDALDQFGRVVKVNLLKGQFKQFPNNPKREDADLKFFYCPPEQTESEMDNLLSIYQIFEDKKAHPVIKAAFFHHAFTQIHPFQDGNGRMARLLASLILVKEELFPLTITAKQKKEYIDCLEKSDEKEYQSIVDFFCKVQIENIELALNRETIVDKSNYQEIVGVFTDKVKNLKSWENEQRLLKLSKNREDIFYYCADVTKELVEELKKQLSNLAQVVVDENCPGEKRDYYFTYQIAEYAKRHKYYFNVALPKGWIRIKIKLSEDKNYNLIITLHHFGYDDSTLAIGAFLEFIEEAQSNNKYNSESVRKVNDKIFVMLPLDIYPLTISVDVGIQDLERNIRAFIQDTLTIALAHLANQI